jgi:hypothetical protein
LFFIALTAYGSSGLFMYAGSIPTLNFAVLESAYQGMKERRPTEAKALAR